MYHQVKPFIQHAVRHGQALLSEPNKAVSISQSLVSICDEILYSIQAGNLQGAATAAQNARNMAWQTAQAAQQLNNTINERMEMATYVLGRIQFRINELASALQSVKAANTGFDNRAFYPEPLAYSTPTASWQTTPTLM